jgi:hypothetical protein
MSEKKKSRGRPRIYKDDAEKQKAFREKRKEQFRKLEGKIKELEKKVAKDLDQQLDKNQPWYNWTFQEIKTMRTKQLQEYKKELEKNLGKRSIHSPLRVIVEEVLSETEVLDASLIRYEVLRSAREFDNTLFNSSVLQLVNMELGNRISEIDFDREIEIAEQRISELEAEIKEKKDKQISIAKKTS